jgi:hypothetical protein
MERKEDKMPIPYIPCSEQRISEKLQEASRYVRAAIQILEEDLDRDIYGYVSDCDVALLSVSLAFESPETEDLTAYIKGQILNWLSRQ